MVNITGSTQLLGVMGYPIEHSLSPALHNAALFSRAVALASAEFKSAEFKSAEPELEYIYLPLKVPPEHLGAALQGMMAIGWRGFNVTIPHKQAVMPYLQQISPLAEAVGAVNTVWREGEAWAGTNTDVHGFLAPLQAYEVNWSAVDACVLGGGGAARAVIVACAQLGCRSVRVVGRDRAKLEPLQHSLGVSLKTLGLDTLLSIAEWQDLDQYLPQAGLLVNTTPIGMYPKVGESPLSSERIGRLPLQAIVYDLIYTPRPTKLLTDAQALGYRVLDGLEMLIHQGAAAFEIWVGEPPSIAAMRQAAIAQLQPSPKA